MLDIFRSLCTFFRRRGTCIDISVSRLHYRVTVAILLIFSLILVLNVFLKRPLSCSIEDRSVPADFINQYCWSVFTYSDPEGTGPSIYPGVSLNTHMRGTEISHYYYPWIWIYLFFQAVVFYLPHWFWKTWEGGKLQVLRNSINTNYIVEEEKVKGVSIAVEYLYNNRYTHNLWTYSYILSEVLALINVLVQMSVTDDYLGGGFWTYGVDEHLSNRLLQTAEGMNSSLPIFPSLGQCKYRYFGASGVTIHRTAICVLPLNVLNEKFYKFIWFWFILLIVVSVVFVIFLIAVVFIPELRSLIMRMRYWNIHKDVINTFVSHSRVGDWFLVYMLGENLDFSVFRDIMNNLAHRLTSKVDNTIEILEVR